jgi:hypothetical protein
VPATLTASVSSVPELGGMADLIFTLGGIAPPATLTLQISGTGANGVDYQTIPSQVTIPGGQTRVTLSVVPIADTLVEGTETLTVTITASDSPCVFVGSPNTVTISRHVPREQRRASSGGNLRAVRGRRRLPDAGAAPAWSTYHPPYQCLRGFDSRIFYPGCNVSPHREVRWHWRSSVQGF